MAVYGRTSLVSDFKLTRENDALSSSRHKYTFEVPHKRYFTNTARTFSVSYLEYLGFEVPRFRPFR